MVEVKKIVAKRRPPGDRWSFCRPPGGSMEDEIYDSLTDMLQFIFERTGRTNFYINSLDGTISIVEFEEEPNQEEPEKTWSLYGEE